MLSWDNLTSDTFQELKLVIDTFESMLQLDGIMNIFAYQTTHKTVQLFQDRFFCNQHEASYIQLYPSIDRTIMRLMQHVQQVGTNRPNGKMGYTSAKIVKFLIVIAINRHKCTSNTTTFGKDFFSVNLWLLRLLNYLLRPVVP